MKKNKAKQKKNIVKKNKAKIVKKEANKELLLIRTEVYKTVLNQFRRVFNELRCKTDEEETEIALDHG